MADYPSPLTPGLEGNDPSPQIGPKHSGDIPVFNDDLIIFFFVSKLYLVMHSTVCLRLK